MFRLLRWPRLKLRVRTAMVLIVVVALGAGWLAARERQRRSRILGQRYSSFASVLTSVIEIQSESAQHHQETAEIWSRATERGRSRSDELAKSGVEPITHLLAADQRTRIELAVKSQTAADNARSQAQVARQLLPRVQQLAAHPPSRPDVPVEAKLEQILGVPLPDPFASRFSLTLTFPPPSPPSFPASINEAPGEP